MRRRHHTSWKRRVRSQGIYRGRCRRQGTFVSVPPIDTIQLVFKEDRERITTDIDRAGSALRIHDLFQQNPFLTANQLVQKTGLSPPTVNAALTDLERFGIVEEVTGRKRGRVFSYRRYLAILSEGTDPLPAAV
nr:winged helix-turn-helix transcriptional regulator [Rhizobium laguerreae]